MSTVHSESPSSMAEVRVGTVLAGKYRVDRILGRGGMGIVVAATHLELDTLVAIKLLLPEVRNNEEVVARFSREARAAARIKSEFVARTLDVGKLDNGCPYIVMEYLEGGDLSQRLAEQGPLPIGAAVHFILQACDALSEAHAMGIIHRDLKPSNLFVTRRRDGTEVTKMLDFGISKLSPTAGSSPELSMTRTTSIMGSPLYMSPEQLVASRNVDPRSDIWALGVTLYEALAGKPPFGGESLPELCAKVMTQPAPPLTEVRPDVPPQLEAVVMRCLCKEPAQRYATASELAAALMPFAPASTTGMGQRSRVALGIATDGAASAQLAAGAPMGGRTVNAWGHTNNEDAAIPKHSIWLPVTLGILALSAVAAGVVVWKLRSAEPVQPTAQPASAASAQQLAPAVASVAPATATVPDAASAAHAASASSAVVITLAPPAASAPSVATPVAVKKPGPTDRSHPVAPAVKAKPAIGQKTQGSDLFGDRK